MNTAILLVQMNSGETNSTPEYIIGGLIVLFILGYLVYSLVKPEKF